MYSTRYSHRVFIFNFDHYIVWLDIPIHMSNICFFRPVKEQNKIVQTQLLNGVLYPFFASNCIKRCFPLNFGQLFRIFFPVFWIEQLQLTASEPRFSCCIENPSPTKILTINPCLVLIQMQKYHLFSRQPLGYWKLTLHKYPKNGRDKFELYASSFPAIYFLHGCTVGIFIREKLQAKLTLERTLFWIIERVLMGNVCARF